MGVRLRPENFAKEISDMSKDEEEEVGYIGWNEDRLRSFLLKDMDGSTTVLGDKAVVFVHAVPEFRVSSCENVFGTRGCF